MKESFPSYYTLSKEKFDSLWSNSTFVFDSCVLINLYTYSRDASDDFLKLLAGLQDRVWMPYHVGLEYHRKRVSVIYRHSKKYTELQHKLTTLLADLEHKKQHPFVDIQILEEFKSASDKLTKQLDSGKKTTKSLIRDDHICAELTDIFHERIGEKYSEKWLQDLYLEGKERFTNKTPPGFKDTEKGEPLCYGDLIIWKEIIKKAQDESASIIFVTDDVKEDWWRIYEGENLGAHLDLLDEFRLNTGQDIHFYTTDMFLKQAKNSGYEISSGTLDEIEAANHNRHSESDEATFFNTESETMRHIRNAALLTHPESEEFRHIRETALENYPENEAMRHIRDSAMGIDTESEAIRRYREVLLNTNSESEAMRNYRDAALGKNHESEATRRYRETLLNTNSESDAMRNYRDAMLRPHLRTDKNVNSGMIDLYESMHVEDGEPVYMSNGMYLFPDGSLKKL